MKRIAAFLVSICWMFGDSACANDGTIHQFKIGTYQILYPNQSINVFFRYAPTYTLANLVDSPNLNPQEQEYFVQLIKEQTDLLPTDFINQYLDVEVYPSRIKDTNTYGYHYIDQIIIEVEKIKPNLSYNLSIKSSYLHEIAHLLEESEDLKYSIEKLKSDFYSINKENDKAFSSGDIFDCGFVSEAARGDFSGEYNVSNEFAETFAYLIHEESRQVLLSYMEKNTNSVLASKIDVLAQFLNNNIPSLGSTYLYRKTWKNYEKSAKISNDKPNTDFRIEKFNSEKYNDHIAKFDPQLDGDALLFKHELKSYESSTFSDPTEFESQKIVQKSPYVDEDMKNETQYEEDKSKYETQYTDRLERNLESASKELDEKLENRAEKIETLFSKVEKAPIENFHYNPYSFDNPYQQIEEEAYSEPDKNNNRKKKKKKKKGTGLLIAAGLIYLTLELLSN